MSQSVRKKCRDSLGERVIENRYKANRKLKTLFSTEVDLFMCPRLLKYMRELKKLEWPLLSLVDHFLPLRKFMQTLQVLQVHATPEYFKARKMAIYYQFLLYGAPEEEQWANVNLINTIMSNLCISRGNFQRVRKTLLDCLQSIQLNMEYNPLACYENNGAEPKIKDFDDSANVVYTALQTGMSYPQVTSLVNIARLREGKELVCCCPISCCKY